jgi:hypothetical protein
LAEAKMELGDESIRKATLKLVMVSFFFFFIQIKWQTQSSTQGRYALLIFLIKDFSVVNEEIHLTI